MYSQHDRIKALFGHPCVDRINPDDESGEAQFDYPTLIAWRD
jgi:hypothetical protein